MYNTAFPKEKPERGDYGRTDERKENKMEYL